MKKARILLSAALIAALLLALCVSVFAVGETIKVVDANVGTYTYGAYKIFDAQDVSGNVSYTLPGGSSWVGELIVDTSADPLVSKFPGLEFTSNGSGGYSVRKLMDFSAANFAQFLSNALTRTSPAPITPASIAYTPDTTTQTATFSVDGAPGYYLITYGTGGSKTGAEPYALTTVLPGQQVTVQNKHDMPFDKDVKKGTEYINEQGVQIGDVLTFEIKGKVPVTTPSDTFYYYYIKDTLSKGLQFDPSSFHVSIDSTDITSSLIRVTDPSATLVGDKYRFDERTPNEYTFDLSLDMLTRAASAGKDIVVTYTATVTADAAGTVVNNKANLTYGNDPDHLVNKDAETRNYVSQIIIDKFETGNNAQKLSGAEFVLYKTVNEGGTDVIYYYRYNTESNALSWVKSADLATADNPAASAVDPVVDASAAGNITKVVTDSDGSAKFIGLENGDYKLKEIKAPDGYVLLSEDIDVHVDGTAALDPSLTAEQQKVNLTQIANVANTPGSVLPSTGGRGTTMLYAAGLFMIVASGAFLIFRRRPEPQQ